MFNMLRCLRSLNVSCLLFSYCKQDHFENYEWRRASWYNSYINQGYKAAFAYPASAFTAWYKVDIGISYVLIRFKMVSESAYSNFAPTQLYIYAL